VYSVNHTVPSEAALIPKGCRSVAGTGRSAMMGAAGTAVVDGDVVDGASPTRGGAVAAPGSGEAGTVAREVCVGAGGADRGGAAGWEIPGTVTVDDRVTSRVRLFSS
jgi:hypothetical protein